jgi:hypothetical protein
MPTQSDFMKDLLAGVECRPVLHYAAGQVFETLMRHVLAAVAVGLRPGGVAEATVAALLMMSPRLALLAASSRHPAGTRAVPLAAIAAAADEEDLPALGAMAHDEAQRIHGSGRDRQELDADLEPCDEEFVEPGSGRTT